MKLLACLATAACVPFALVLGLVAIGSSTEPANASAAQVCITTGPLAGLDAAAAMNARIVTAVAERRAGSDGAVIAVMTADTESGLHVLGNTHVPGAAGTQGSGTNLDSVGLFQQRASWGPVSQRLDPAQATSLFVDRLVAVRGWQALQPWVAAQRVQVSAWDGHPRLANNDSSDIGGNYRTKLTTAQQVVAHIDGSGAESGCGALSGGIPASTVPGSHGLPASYSIPASATSDETKVVMYAIAQLDKPYVFGAAGPSSFDCSGLVLAAWRTAGVDLPHLAASQADSGTATTVDALVPGDLVFVSGDDGTLAAPGHVGIYMGSGLVVNAADEQVGIRVQTYNNFVAVGHGLAALRHIR